MTPAPATHRQAQTSMQAKAPKVHSKPHANAAVTHGKSKVADGMGLDLGALERDSQNQAGGVMAGQLAQRAQVLLARSAADEHKAEAFDREVRTLRGNATALAEAADVETRAAARAALMAVANKAMAKLAKLQEQERKAVAAAEAKRSEVSSAMARVRDAQASLRSS